MTLRARLALLVSGAVALAVLAASVAAWVLIRSSLLADIDRRLLERVSEAEQIAAATQQLAEQEGTRSGPSLYLSNDPIGVQLLEPDGRTVQKVAPADAELELTDEERRLLDGESDEPFLRTEIVDGASARVMTAALDQGGLVRLVQPLDPVESTLTRIAWLLVGIAGVGVAAAGALGSVVGRAGLRPVDRLAAAAEQVAATKDLGHRIDIADIDDSARDEVTRLAGSLNAMLAALDDERVRQRQLVEDAGHELRTPIATLRNDLGLLIRAERHPDRTLPPADRARLMQDLDTEVAALGEMIGEIVDLSRGGAEPEAPLETDLRELVDRAAARSRRIAPEVTIAVHGPSFEAVARPATLERAVANLIRNAVQVSTAGDRVDVELLDVGGTATIRVLDRGPGIPAAERARVFDRFYRGVTAREHQGSGLGLAIVAQAAGQHGGQIDVAARPGGGSVFTLRFPAHLTASACSD